MVKSAWAATAIGSLVVLFYSASAWYGIRSNAHMPVAIPSGSVAVPAAPLEKVTKIEKADKTDLTVASPFMLSRKEPLLSKINGRWVGAVDLGGGNRLNFSFNLREKDGQVTGTATFPVGEGVIENGKIVADQLSFVTRHRLPSNGQVLLTQFSGTLADGGLKLTMLSEGGKSYLTLNPVSR